MIFFVGVVFASRNSISFGYLRRFHTWDANYFTSVNVSDLEGVHAVFTNSSFHTMGVVIIIVVKMLKAVRCVWGIFLAFELPYLM